MEKNIELREQRAQIVKDMADIAQSTKPDDIEKWNRMDAAQKEMLAQIQRIEASSNLEKEMRGTGNPPPPAGGEDPSVLDAKEYDKAFRSFLRSGLGRDNRLGTGVISEEHRNLIMARRVPPVGEQRDMVGGGQAAYPGATAGFFIPVGYRRQIEEALKYYGPMLGGGMGYPEIFSTDSGAPLPFPTDDDTSQTGEMVGEGQQVTTQDVSLGQLNFGAYKFSSKLIKVSVELLQDSAFDLDPYLTKKFATRLGRILNTKFTTGTGTNEPKGIVTAATSAGTAAGANSNDGSSAANTIGSDDLTTLEHSVDPLYRNGAKYMFHDSVLAALKKVKDKYGRPLWMVSVRESEPDSINGYGYLINNDMDQLQTASASPQVTKKPILFGAIDKYLIRRVREMSVLRLEERFADYGQVAFIAFARYDGNLLDAGTHPVKYLQTTY